MAAIVAIMRPMQALVTYSSEPGSVELREIDQPMPDKGEVLVKVEAVGVCGSDLHMWKGPVSWPMSYPVIMGHEFAGTIAAVDAGVEQWRAGQRVACETAAKICGVCEHCRTGNYNLCPQRKGFGAVVDGAMAQYIAVRQGILHHIPDLVSFEEAALAEPAAVAFNAVYVKSRLTPGDFVVVIGPGPIGLMVLQMVKLCTPAHVVMVGLTHDECRLEKAREFGADSIVVGDREDPVDAVNKLSDGKGAHLVLDAVGVRTTFRQSLLMVRPAGQITKIGWDKAPPDHSLDPLVLKAATLQGTFSHTWTTWERVLSLMELSRIDVRAMSQSFSLEDWEQAFRTMDSLQIAKAVIVP